MMAMSERNLRRLEAAVMGPVNAYNYRTWDAQQWREWYEATERQDLVAAVVRRLKEWEITACDECAVDIVGLVQERSRRSTALAEPRSHLRMLAHTTGTCPICSRAMP